MGEAGEDADDLDVALYAHPFVVAVEFGEIVPYRQAELARHFPVAREQVEGEIFFPLDIGILEKRDQVVGQRAVDGVLEVDDARIGAVGDVHQVARVIIAVDEDFWFREVDRDDLVENGRQRGFFFGIERDALVAGDVPVGEQHQLVAQQFVGIRGQLARTAGGLDGEQGADRVGVQVRGGERGAIGRAQFVEIGRIAEIGHEQKTLLGVFSQDFGDVDAGGAEQAGDDKPGFTVFVLGRRVHDDQAGMTGNGGGGGVLRREKYPEITAETGIGRSGCNFVAGVG